MKTEVIILAVIGILIGTVTSRSFWKLVLNQKCKHCDGSGEIEHIGEGFSEPCEHCQKTTKNSWHSELNFRVKQELKRKI